jgi:hypothetical protein
MRPLAAGVLILLVGPLMSGCNEATTVAKPPPTPAEGGAGSSIGPDRNAFVATQDPFGENVTKVVYLGQNWSPEESNRFYFTAQGSQIIPYDWFLALEQADSTTPFRDNLNILKYRYLAQKPGPLNPDGLPVGFVSDQGVGRAWLGMTCAACHTNEIHLGGIAYRVDGAPTLGDIQGFLSAMIAGMQQTRADAAKFDRFAAKVLGTQNTPQNQLRLKSQLDFSIKTREGYNLRNFPGYDPKTLVQPPHQFGRLDAVDSIVNEVYNFAVKKPDLNNPTVVSKTADAAVSYPCLWDTPQSDIVEWLGIAKNGGPLDVLSLSRNVGEVLGVFGVVKIPDEPNLFDFGYASTVKISALSALEDQLKGLWAPQWPGDFPKIDQDAAAKGALLYKTDFDGSGSCVDCHALINRADPNRKVVAVMGASGTDPQAFKNFFNRTGPSGRLEGVDINFVPFTAKIPAIADANTMLTNMVSGTILGNLHNAPPDELNRLNFKAPPSDSRSVTVEARYKGRPLDGIWATAPYLHNGSVPNLDALLKPTAQRPKSFSVGVREYDPVLVGFKTDAKGFPSFTVNDATGAPLPGNSNAGHEFGTGLTDEQRHQLVEYLKTL